LNSLASKLRKNFSKTFFEVLCGELECPGKFVEDLDNPRKDSREEQRIINSDFSELFAHRVIQALADRHFERGEGAVEFSQTTVNPNDISFHTSCENAGSATSPFHEHGASTLE